MMQIVKRSLDGAIARIFAIKYIHGVTKHFADIRQIIGGVNATDNLCSFYPNFNWVLVAKQILD
jgi:hypothetical protein